MSRTLVAVALAALAAGLSGAHKLRLRRRLAVPDAERRGAARIRGRQLLLGATIGCVVAGILGALAGAVAAAAFEPLVAARNARRRTELLDDQIPELARTLASALRAGRNLPQALHAAAETTAEPARSALESATSRLGVGGSVPEALERFVREAQTPAAGLLAEALVIGRAAGANLPAVLDGLAVSLAERRRIERDRRAATAQARLSGAIVAGMPAAFYLMVGSGARRQVAVLFGDPLGWGLLLGGLLLEGAGLLWMRALLRMPR